MKNRTIIAGIVLLSVLTIVSCTKDINLKLRDASGQLVIEGNITNAAGPQYVKLSTNVPFTNPNTYPPVTGATVTINDQAGNSYTLKEGPQGTYSATTPAGTAGTTYSLNVVAKGQTYSANSTMPAAITLDSITSQSKVAVRRPKNEKDKKEITVYYRDPAGINNYYRFVMWVNGVQVNDIFAYDDLLTDGRYVSRNLRESDVDIYSGDTVKVEMQCIDKPMYTYWFTLQRQQSQGLNVPVAPANPPTDISPVTLGYFSAHTTQSMTIVVK